MQRLSLCDGCGRYVASDGAPCPFCGGEVAAPRPVQAVAAGVRLSRAAALAGAAVIGAAGCAPHAVQHDQHQVQVGADAGTANEADAGSSVLVIETGSGHDAQPDAGELIDPDEDWHHRRNNCDMCPYGAPPLPADRIMA